MTFVVMQKLKAWIAAARLRTLPLSVSGIIVGASLALRETNRQEVHSFSEKWSSLSSQDFTSVWESSIFWLAILTTIGFQVLSNFANDYGDGVKGTDAGREGEKRMVASGLISPKQMKRGMTVAAVISLFVASILIFVAFGNEHFFLAFVFFNLAIAAVVAAIKYTVGKSAYGYSGFGDLFVFIFFGLLSVMGSYFLYIKGLQWDLLLPAISVGTFSVAVLNLNNMRDQKNDAAAGKKTLVVKLGSEKAKTYHVLLLIVGMFCAVGYTLLNLQFTMQFLYAIAFIPLVLNIITVIANKEPALLDSELKKVALSTFAFAIIFGWLH